jgi:hypothetical protein
MPELVLHGRPVGTVFDLLGRTENDMTYALGWGSTRRAKVLEGFAGRVPPGVGLNKPVVVGNWPKTPPNYIAFRYWGRLQSIHHVDEYTIFENPHQADPAWPDLGWDPHFLLTLGPAIRPPTEVRTGKGIVLSARVWVDIDLLLTSATITEAAQRTRERRAANG